MTVIGFLASLSLGGAAHPASAGPLSITPTQVTLAAQNATELVTLLNESDTPARFEVTVSAWSEGEDGVTKLTPASDILVYPPLLEMAPHSTTKIRLGAVVPAPVAERAYRMMIQEIPSAVTPPGQAEIRVLTKISIPVFLVAPGAKPAIEIAGAHFQNGVLAFTLVNPGTEHYQVRRIEVAGQGAAGHSFTVGENGWYVLVDGKRTYQVALADHDCIGTSQISIAAIGDGSRVDSQLPISPMGCAPGGQTRFVTSNLDHAPPAPH